MKINFRLFVGASLLMSVLFFLAACGGSSSSSSTTKTDSDNNSESEVSEVSNETEIEETHFRATMGLPSTHLWYASFAEPVMQEIEAITDNVVTFDSFVAGELIPLGTEYDALRQGSIEIAFSLALPYDPARFPYTEVSLLPLLESDPEIIAIAAKNMMESDRIIADGKTYYELEFEDNGIIGFVNPPTPPYVIATRENSLNSIEEFSEMLKMRSPSRVHDILSRELSVTALQMTSSDAYDALSRGALDGVYLSIADWDSIGLTELFNYGIDGVNFGHFVGHTAMTIEKWESLPKELQHIFTTTLEDTLFTGVKDWDDGTNRALENFKGNGGELINFEELDPAVQDHITNAMVQTWYTWIDNLEDAGHAGKEIAMLWRDMVVEAGGKVPEEIMDLQ
ncbi:hypothetical protein [Alkalihalobacterium alkalinitrilicum]|uniref:hypothetical protein n=1 Tax=Alkalihalobacterium alkalinitrilicum TaxID=427920 RepID=UPI0009952DDF|nr:hypothetical protein [Alkalihalobacterium alkalinitrilicum]